mgnify:FL=1
MNRPIPIVLIGAGLVFIGMLAIAGGLGGFALSPFFLPGIASATAIVLAGGALLFAQARPPIQSVAQRTLGVVLLAVAIVGRFPGLLGVEAAEVATSEVLAIALMGATLVAFHTGRLPPILIQIALLVMIAAGLFGLAGYFLDLETLYRGYAEVRIAPLPSMALVVYTVGLWGQSHRMAWHQRLFAGRDDKRIPVISGAILLGIAISAGLAGFALMAKTTQEVLTNSLTISLEHRVRTFQTSLDSATQDVMLASTRPRFNVLMAKHAKTGVSDAESQEIQRILDDIIKNTPIVALVVYDAHGRIVGKRGELVHKPPFQARLAVKGDVLLLWKDVTVLRASAPIKPKGERVGLLVADVPLHAIDRLFRDYAGLGQNGSMGVCAAKGDGILCMPSRANKFRVIQAPRYSKGAPVPMSFALDNKVGVVTTIDVQGENVYSAHSPIGKLGLGMIVKVQSNELYQPVKNQLGYTLGAISILVIIGIVLLRWQITPMARNLVAQIHERKLAEERFAHLAHHDSLTGLPNRVLFHDHLQLAMTDANRRQQSVVVMFLDVDRFKTINDTLGHDSGDELLKQIAQRLTACLRAGDTVSRLAGDEFALVLPGVENIEYSRHLAQRIIGSFTESFQIRDQQIFITASIGITLYPADASTVEDLLKNADTVMYRAKDSGRNNFQFYSADMHAQAVKRLTLENQLRGAIERAELVLHYQPLVNLKNGEIDGMEALLRWNHPELGLVPPLDFIPLAEESGLIIPIGRWVLQTACAQARAWQDAGLPPLRVSMNLSARQFQKNLVDTVETVLRETGLEPQRLELELTESVVMQNPEMAVTTLDVLDRLGVRLSIDDFGTGYSSLSYLRRFPINTLKIDRSFVSDIPGDGDDMKIITAIITLAHSLGIRVVAEGVETAEQLSLLRELRCDAMQGYIFSKPLPANEFAQLVREGRSLPASG